jgi:hypothetical protein
MRVGSGMKWVAVHDFFSGTLRSGSRRDGMTENRFAQTY